MCKSYVLEKPNLETMREEACVHNHERNQIHHHSPSHSHPD
jgi:hypothetical protein